MQWENDTSPFDASPPPNVAAEAFSLYHVSVITSYDAGRSWKVTADIGLHPCVGVGPCIGDLNADPAARRLWRARAVGR